MTSEERLKIIRDNDRREIAAVVGPSTFVLAEIQEPGTLFDANLYTATRIILPESLNDDPQSLQVDDAESERLAEEFAGNLFNDNDSVIVNGVPAAHEGSI